MIFVDGSLTSSQQAIFTTAANRWAEIITGDLPQGSVDASFFVDNTARTFDDIAIEARAEPDDGIGGTLGSAGPRFLRGGSNIPAMGEMTFDTADIANLESSGALLDVIPHEMGHVLGIGTIWSNLGLITGVGGTDPRFLGSRAVAEYNTIFGNSDSSIPVADNTEGVSTRDAHWRESVFENELMTGALDAGVNPLSRITVAMLADLGYTVDMNAADAYTAPAPSTAPTGQSSGGEMYLLVSDLKSNDSDSAWTQFVSFTTTQSVGLEPLASNTQATTIRVNRPQDRSLASRRTASAEVSNVKFSGVSEAFDSDSSTASKPAESIA